MSGESLRVMILRVASTVHRGLERRQFVERAPAVVEGDARQRLVAAGGIALRAAAAPALVLDHDAEQFGGVVDKVARRRGGQLLHRRASLGLRVNRAMAVT